MKCQLSLLAALIAAGLSVVYAAPVLSHAEIESKTAQGLRLLTLSEGAAPVWKTEEEKLALMRAEKHFFDVTETYETELKLKAAAKDTVSIQATFPAPSHQSQVNALIPSLSTSNMQSYLTTLTAYNNRYYKSTTGQQSSAWILSKVKDIIGSTSGVTASAFTHSWVQSSVIVKFAGSSASSPVTIIGAHQDSINLSNPTSGRAPGADDDGTGTVNLIEILRVLIASGYKPKTPLEFHWYSGEEAGLLGSNAVATKYKSDGVAVKAMMELDMTGYFKPGSSEVIALEADYVDSGLNTFVKSLVTSYSKLSWAMDKACGYACSDHASWYNKGYPTTMPFEAVTGNDNAQIHSTGDTTSVSGFSWSHSLEFAKVALGFAVELTS